ncbi:MAG: hypothetical protein JSR59_14040 [Proteobacteria bacterium]|nr:hypothetical protein [Pseudomonadota bacterium]
MSRYPSKLSLPFRSTWWLPMVVACVMAGLWYLVSGAAAMRTALPWLAAALGLSWLCGIAALLAFAPYRAMPRAIRLRRAVESSLFWSRMSEADPANPADSARCAFHLRHAIAAASDAALKARLRKLADDGLRSADDFKHAAAELSDILLRLVGKNRTEAGREFVAAPEEFAWTVTLVVACVALAARLRSFPVVPMTWADLVVPLTVAAVAYPLAKLLLLVRYQIGISRLHARRVVFVTDSLDSVIDVAALMHLSSRAQLVGVIIGASREVSLALNGADLYFGGREFARCVCDAFMPAADRLVVHCDDDALPAELLALAHAHGTPCQALSTDGSVPDGYAWLDPVLLRSHGQPAAAWANTGAQFAAGLSLAATRRVPLWAEPRPWRWLALSIVLAAIPGAAFAAAVALATAVCEWAIKLLEPRRRARMGRVALRRPRDAAWSARLEPKKLEWRLRIGIWSITVLALAVFAVLHYAVLKEAGRVTIGVVMLLFWPLPLAAEALVTASLLGTKWFLDRDFRIAVFRRNATAYGYAHKAMVLAVCGRYGQVASLTDYSLEATTSGTGEWREEHLGTWFRVFSEVWTPLVPDVFLRDWRLQVISELAASDAAVFDWAEEVTDHMRWELRTAMQLLPANRILVVLGSDAVGPSGHETIVTVTLPRKRDDQYVWPDNSSFGAGFAEALRRLLQDLQHDPRPYAELVATETTPAVLQALERLAAAAESGSQRNG